MFKNAKKKTREYIDNGIFMYFKTNWTPMITLTREENIIHLHKFDYR